MNTASDDARIERLHKFQNLKRSGYCGVNTDGNIVDRREHPEAIAMAENEFFHIPWPRKLYGEDGEEWVKIITQEQIREAFARIVAQFDETIQGPEVVGDE